MYYISVYLVVNKMASYPMFHITQCTTGGHSSYETEPCGHDLVLKLIFFRLITPTAPPVKKYYWVLTI